MPRTARASVGGICYHVMSRGNRGQRVFHKRADYAAFLNLVARARRRLPMRLLAFCLMPNHFHLVLWPRADGDLGRWMHWLLTCHVRRYHHHYGTSGRLWQGRFKAFPVQNDLHLLTVMRYVERNPLRAGLVERAEDWPWSSLPLLLRPSSPGLLDEGPLPRFADWLGAVNEPLTVAELAAVRVSASRQRPYGTETWVVSTAARLGLVASIRPRGRPSDRSRLAVGSDP